MNGIPETTSGELISKLNALQEREFGDIKFQLAKLKREASNLQKVDAISAFIIQGIIASLENNTASMESFYNKAMKLDKNDPDVLFNYATSLNYCREHHKALEVFEQMLNLGINMKMVVLKLATTHSVLGHYSEAYKYAMRYLSEFPKDVDVSIQEMISMKEFLDTNNIPESDIQQYAAIMNDILEKNDVRTLYIRSWLTDDDEVVRDVAVKSSPETISKLNDELIQALSNISLSEDTIFNFSGYFVPATLTDEVQSVGDYIH